MAGSLHRSVFKSYLAVIALCVGAVSVLLIYESTLGGPRHGFMLAAGLALVAVVAAAAAWLVTARFVKPLVEMQQSAERFRQGNFTKKFYVDEPGELQELGKALNRMATQLDERLDQLTRQTKESESVLESLSEGVLAIDNGDRILSLNRAAEMMLGIRASAARGRLVQEMIRNADVQRILTDARDGNLAEEPAEGWIVNLAGSITLRLSFAPLRDDEDRHVGLVVILANVTRVHQLENLRREFVANVSHELRTPITSIRGYAETLLDGALEDPAQARKFVDVIMRQSERLGGIIEDLLALSRLERAIEIERAPCKLRTLLQAAIDVCRKAGPDVEVALDCDPMLVLPVNAVLLEQSIANLVDNAIKYSSTDPRVSVTARAVNGEAVIEILDNGPGIAAEHLPRIFERFYRVDKARSREMGGTGLGLSIVKNVAQAHGGRVEVESTLGKGSLFRVILPIP